jgi:hypothetical protein
MSFRSTPSPLGDKVVLSPSRNLMKLIVGFHEQTMAFVVSSSQIILKGSMPWLQSRYRTVTVAFFSSVVEDQRGGFF